MYWANFLHIYQPPTQSREILLKVAEESYRKILAGLIANPQAKLTLNINAGLTEMLVENDCLDIIENIKSLAIKGQIELTASAKYHAFLPQLPEAQIIRQIELNNFTNKKYFGEAYHPQGFFPPEMGYDPKLGEIISKLGFKWTILDETALPQDLNPTKTFSGANGLVYFFRERQPSFKILSAQLGTARSVVEEFKDRLGNEEYLLTAMDGETFGHHRLGLDQLLTEIYQLPQIKTVLIPELINLFPQKVEVTPKASTWAFVERDILKNLPFSRWNDPENPIHQRQWQLTNLVIKLAEKESPAEQERVDKALYSDQYWWASAKPWWSLEQIERGAFELLTAVRNFKHVTTEDLIQANELYLEIIKTGFEWQRNGTVARLSRKEDEDIIARMSQGKTNLTKADYEEMTSHLKTEMLTAAKNQDYARAESLKKRIQELSTNQTEIKVNQ